MGAPTHSQAPAPPRPLPPGPDGFLCPCSITRTEHLFLMCGCSTHQSTGARVCKKSTAAAGRCWSPACHPRQQPPPPSSRGPTLKPRSSSQGTSTSSLAGSCLPLPPDPMSYPGSRTPPHMLTVVYVHTHMLTVMCSHVCSHMSTGVRSQADSHTLVHTRAHTHHTLTHTCSRTFSSHSHSYSSRTTRHKNAPCPPGESCELRAEVLTFWSPDV